MFQTSVWAFIELNVDLIPRLFHFVQRTRDYSPLEYAALEPNNAGAPPLRCHRRSSAIRSTPPAALQRLLAARILHRLVSFVPPPSALPRLIPPVVLSKLVNSMRWLKNWHWSPTNGISKFIPLSYHNADTYAISSTHNFRRILNSGCLDELDQTGRPYPVGSGKASISFLANPISTDAVRKPQYEMRGPHSMLQVHCRRFGSSVQNGNSMGRDWLAQLWLAEKRKRIVRRKVKHPIIQRDQTGFTLPEALSSFQLPFVRSFLSRLAPDEQETPVKRILKQPPITQHDGGFLSPSSREEVKLEPLLALGTLLITRDIEWANIMLAFEQESRYVIVDPCYPQAPVGSIREQSNVIFRQLLRSRRPFIAHITDALGNEIFRVRRPFWLINSTIYAEVDGKEIGVVHRRWHLWRRIYDLYLGNKQFAVVENPGFWNWTFTLKDDNDNVLAQIDRDWRGLGLELFTDAGQYVIRFRDSDSYPKFGLASAISDLEVARPLTLSERAITVALAVSLDTDYFSRHGGWGLPIFIAGE